MNRRSFLSWRFVYLSIFFAAFTWIAYQRLFQGSEGITFMRVVEALFLPALFMIFIVAELRSRRMKFRIGGKE